MSTHCNIFALRFLFVGAPFFSPECAFFRWSPLYFERHWAAPARWSTGRLIKNISLKFKSASQTSSQTTKILFPDCLSRGSDALQIALPPKICAGLGSIPDPYRTCYYTVVHTCVHKKVFRSLAGYDSNLYSSIQQTVIVKKSWSIDNWTWQIRV